MSTPQANALPVPYTSRLLSQIQHGQTLIVRGTVPTGAKRFEINLLNDTTEIDEHKGSATLHVSVRFDEGKVVLNSFLGAQWGKEERHSNPFKVGEPFDIRIRVHDDKYELTANQKHLADYKHRENFSTVDYLQVRGDVNLQAIHWGGRYFEIPFTTAFHGGHLQPGQRVFIYGEPKGDFSVNFLGQNKEDIHFHFNPRFSEKKVVRNNFSNTSGAWGNEEREGEFTFKKGQGFDLVIQNEPYSLQIFINDHRFGTFAHRANPDHDYKALSISGEVEITGVEVSR